MDLRNAQHMRCAYILRRARILYETSLLLYVCTSNKNLAFSLERVKFYILLEKILRLSETACCINVCSQNVSASMMQTVNFTRRRKSTGMHLFYRAFLASQTNLLWTSQVCDKNGKAHAKSLLIELCILLRQHKSRKIARYR